MSTDNKFEVVQLGISTLCCSSCGVAFKEGDVYRVKKYGNEPTERTKEDPQQLRQWYRIFGFGAGLLVHEVCE